MKEATDAVRQNARIRETNIIKALSHDISAKTTITNATIEHTNQ